MTRYLSEAEAWREIARRIAERGLLASGLCYELDELRKEGRITVERHWNMADRIAAHAPDRAYAFPPYANAVRVFAALFLALECEDEAKAAKRRAA